MQSNTVLVTGADGFTGRFMMAELKAAGFEVHGTSHRPKPGLHTCDLADAAQVAQVVHAVQPALVVHLAAIAFVAHGDVEAIYKTNVLGTRHLLEALTRLLVPPHAVLLASSANVYGNNTEGALDEDTPPSPANDYAVSKLAMEYVARLYAGRLPIVLARPFNYTGVGQSESFLVAKIVAHARRGASTIELGNIDVARDFSDVRTVVRCYRRLLETPAAVGQTLNICSGQAYTLREVLGLVEELSGRAMEIRVNPAFVRANEVKVLIGKSDRLEAIVGSVEAPPLRETLRWMLAE